MDPGKLDRRVVILRAQPVDDGVQVRPGVFRPLMTVWAARREVSDRERFAAGTTRAIVETRFTLRWSRVTAGITPNDRLSCDGTLFEIVGVKELGRRHYIEISVRSAT